MAERTQQITVREGAILYHDGRAHLAGEQLELPASEAKALAEQGVIEAKREGEARQGRSVRA